MDNFFLSDIFKTRDERNTIVIAFLVLIFFGWLIYFLGFSNNKAAIELVPAPQDQVVEETLKESIVELPPVVEEKEVAIATEDRDQDGIFDGDDKCPDERGEKNNEGCPFIELEEKEKATLELAVNAVQFQFNKTTLKAESFLILNDILKILKKYPDYNLRIEGHTDSLGDAIKNLQLSKDRAAACYEFFIARGIPASRFEYGGYGETRPIAANTTPTGRAKNRRVQFTLYK